jgi:hypothetical protein
MHGDVICKETSQYEISHTWLVHSFCVVHVCMCMLLTSISLRISLSVSVLDEIDNGLMGTRSSVPGTAP